MGIFLALPSLPVIMLDTLYKILTFRKGFKVISEEVFQLFSEKTLSETEGFLEIERSDSENSFNISKSDLQRDFVKSYSWQFSTENNSTGVNIYEIDAKCQGLYELSIYKHIKYENTFSFKKRKYPIKFKIQL